ncbi:hypothetical protein Pcinc_017084 [Petrolisthes cinctipes]|uniref:Uncharacterized protein n=1 Tax=Petrolisthes cinctipes TaxID=88211 RepID=A0AAE1FPT5_PETCI|nr:hypothetical protein Pcinc_017084 [Petrolisthes cinctipes]
MRDTILPTPRSSYQTIRGKVEGKEIEALKGTRVGAVERSGLLWREVRVLSNSSPASVTSGYQFDLSNSHSHPLTRKSPFPIILRMGEGKSVNCSSGLTMHRITVLVASKKLDGRRREVTNGLVEQVTRVLGT